MDSCPDYFHFLDTTKQKGQIIPLLLSPTPLKSFPLFWQAQNVENHSDATPRVSIGASGDDEAAGANAIADLRRQLELQASEV
jgi:hypothetical protein